MRAQHWPCSLSPSVTSGWPAILRWLLSITLPFWRALCSRGPKNDCAVSSQVPLMDGHFKTIVWVELYNHFKTTVKSSMFLETWTMNVQCLLQVSLKIGHFKTTIWVEICGYFKTIYWVELHQTEEPYVWEVNIQSLFITITNEWLFKTSFKIKLYWLEELWIQDTNV